MDPCNPPAITEPAPGSLEYTITADLEVLQLSPLYATDPSWCSFDTKMRAPTQNRVDEYLVYDKDLGTITVNPILDTLVPSGSTELVYTVVTRVTTMDYDGNKTTKDVSHTLTIKNPCINTSFVSIELPSTLANMK